MNPWLALSIFRAFLHKWLKILKLRFVVFIKLIFYLIRFPIFLFQLKIAYTNLCKSTQNLEVNRYSLTLTTKYPAVFVYLDLIPNKYNITKYSFSQNGFMLVSPIMVIYLEIEATQCINKLNRNDIKIFTVNQYKP